MSIICRPFLAAFKGAAAYAPSFRTLAQHDVYPIPLSFVGSDRNSSYTAKEAEKLAWSYAAGNPTPQTPSTADKPRRFTSMVDPICTPQRIRKIWGLWMFC